jgi:hypothetical protein
MTPDSTLRIRGGALQFPLPLRIAMAMGALLRGAACTDSGRCTDMAFQRLRLADRAVITIDSHSYGKAVRSPEALKALAEFAVEHESGWSAPWYGTQVARLRVDFFSGNRFLGDLGLGPDFLTAQGCGYVQSRSIDRAGRAAVMGLLGAPDPYGVRQPVPNRIF